MPEIRARPDRGRRSEPDRRMERHSLLLSPGGPGAGVPVRRSAVATGRPALPAARLEPRLACCAARRPGGFQYTEAFLRPLFAQASLRDDERSRSSAISRCCRRGRGRPAGASATTSTPPCGRISSTTGWRIGSAARSARMRCGGSPSTTMRPSGSSACRAGRRNSVVERLWDPVIARFMSSSRAPIFATATWRFHGSGRAAAA